MNNKQNPWSWRTNPEELTNQINNYEVLGITKSFKGIVVLIFCGISLISVALSFFGLLLLSDVIISLIIYLAVLIFVYKGHRWAMVVLMVIWTLDKVYTMYLSVQLGFSPVNSIIWWLIVTPYIYKAIKVENMRRKINLINK